MYKRYYEEQRKSLIDKKINSVLEKYGGKEHLDIPEEIRQRIDTVRYNEYNETGTVKAKENYEKPSVIKKAPCVRGHVQAWGSFYHKIFGWGYKCCYSFDFNSLCKGEKQRNFNLNLIKKREEEEKNNLNLNEKIKNASGINLVKEDLKSNTVDTVKQCKNKDYKESNIEDENLIGKKRDNLKFKTVN